MTARAVLNARWTKCATQPVNDAGAADCWGRERTATELLRFGHSWAAVHAIHAARPSAAHPAGRFLLTLTPKAYAGTGVQAVHPDQ